MHSNAIIQYILNVGPDVVLPVIIFIFGLIIRMPVGKAFRAGVIIGVGFVGINLVIGLLGSTVGPAAQAMVKHSGIHLTDLDVGWPSTAAIAYGSVVGALAIPLCLVYNIILGALGLTNTLDIDLWNYWHFAFAGALVEILTHNFALGLFAEIISMTFVLALADWSQPWVKRYFGFDNISFPHGTSTPYFFMALKFGAISFLLLSLRGIILAAHEAFVRLSSAYATDCAVTQWPKAKMLAYSMNVFASPEVQD